MNKWMLTIVLLTGYLWTDAAVAEDGPLTGKLVEIELKQGLYICGPLSLENFTFAVNAWDVSSLEAMMQDDSCEFWWTEDNPQHGQVFTGVVVTHREVNKPFNDIDYVVVLVAGKKKWMLTKFVRLPEGDS